MIITLVVVVLVIVAAVAAYYMYWYERYCTCSGMYKSSPQPVYAFWADADQSSGCGCGAGPRRQKLFELSDIPGARPPPGAC